MYSVSTSCGMFSDGPMDDAYASSGNGSHATIDWNHLGPDVLAGYHWTAVFVNSQGLFAEQTDGRPWESTSSPAFIIGKDG